MIELTFNGINLLITISVIIAMTFGFLLLLPGFNNKANRYLALMIFIVALWNTSLLVLELWIYRYAAGIIWIPLTYTLALGPCFYFYIRQMTDFEFNEKSKIWPHFIPVAIQIMLFWFQVFIGLPQGLGYFQTETFQITDPILNFLAILSLSIYGYLSLLRIHKYHEWVKNNFSHDHRYNLHWLYRFTVVMVLLLLLWLGYLFIDFFMFDYQMTFADYYPFHLSLSVISIWLCVESFVHPTVVFPEQEVPESSTDSGAIMVNNEIRKMAKWLDQQVTKDLLYLDPELSLRSLAEILDMHPNHLSKIINEGCQQRFSDYINRYRIDAVVSKIKSDSSGQTTLLAIAFDCGFNSKTTFNRIFKKIHGMTPKQFRQKRANSQI